MLTRYALIGVGGRGLGMFARPLVQDFPDVAELVALCDPNPRRLALANERLGARIATFQDATEMLATARPDTVIVCSMDSTHAGYIVQALEAGCDVIVEKPMCTTAEQVREVLAAERRTGQRVTVSLNARYGAAAETIWRLLREGAVGEIISVDFAEYLDTSHGADYFRRWHRRKANSGGLLVHKASHHFDQLNWWIGSEPETVYAQGDARFYGPVRPDGSLRTERGERCLTCAYTRTCPFYLDLRADRNLIDLYLSAEAEDGYYRDRCVYADEIDIEDTMVVSLRYANRVSVNYSLNAFAPFEGQRIGFSGTRGRLEVDLIERYHGLGRDGHLAFLPMPQPPTVRISPLFGRPQVIPIEERTGAHGGADERIRQHLFYAERPDPLEQRADSWAGALSVLVGAAANLSMASGGAIRVQDLVRATDA